MKYTTRKQPTPDKLKLSNGCDCFTNENETGCIIGRLKISGINIKLTRQRIRRIKEKALAKLKKDLNLERLNDER